jgi:hypothetical protein
VNQNRRVWGTSGIRLQGAGVVKPIDSARWERIQLVAMYLSPPFGIFPRCVCVKAVGAISTLPSLGFTRLCW